jgi:hypothetical protein
VKHRLILDLCGGTGAWSKPYAEAGYMVCVIDLPQDIRLLEVVQRPVHGILAAPPCTRFSYARNRYPATSEELKDALSIVDACVRIAYALRPAWWALENPVNHLRRYLGRPQWIFRQWEYGDAGEKPTALWGNFTPPMKRAAPRTKQSTFKSKKQNAEPLDAITPPGFARAFFEANP